MRDLGYVYNRSAAGLRATRSGVVGLVLPDIANPFFAEFLEGFESVLLAAGYSVFLAASREDAAVENTTLRRMVEHGCDGLVICPSSGTSAADLDALGGFGKPIVQSLRRVSERFDYIGPDYAQGMRLAVAHLHDLGHERLAFIATGTCTTALLDRRAGLAEALAARGLPPAAEIAFDGKVAGVIAELRSAMDRGVTAAICFSDLFAMRLFGALQDAGIRVGAGLSLIGFDGIRPATLFRPRLASIRTFPAAIGKAAAERLIARIEGPEIPVLARQMPVDLAPGQSVAAASAAQ